MGSVVLHKGQNEEEMIGVVWLAGVDAVLAKAIFSCILCSFKRVCMWAIRNYMSTKATMETDHWLLISFLLLFPLIMGWSVQVM